MGVFVALRLAEVPPCFIQIEFAYFRPSALDFFKEFALALDTTKRLWEQLRYVPVLSEGMRMAEDRRREAIEKAKAENARAN